VTQRPLHDQTREKHKEDRGLGTAIFFLDRPKIKGEKMASIRNISYKDAAVRLASTWGFKWIPYSVLSHADIQADDCDQNECPDSPNCPGVCYCGGVYCHSS
jgi:hypothetical protein